MLLQCNWFMEMLTRNTPCHAHLCCASSEAATWFWLSSHHCSDRARWECHCQILDSACLVSSLINKVQCVLRWVVLAPARTTAVSPVPSGGVPNRSLERAAYQTVVWNAPCSADPLRTSDYIYISKQSLYMEYVYGSG